MSIIKITTAGLAGTMSKDNATGEIFVSKGTKAKVVMTGYLGANQVKGDNGKYLPSAFGRLPLQAALTGEADTRRYVIQIAGGLRGVLFKNTKQGDNQPDYVGNVDLGDGTEFGLFGRKISSENGDFISLTTTSEAKARKDASGAPAPAPAADDGFDDDDIPF